MRPTHGGWHDSCYACTRASTKRQQAGPAGKTSRQDQQAGRTSRQETKTEAETQLALDSATSGCVSPRRGSPEPERKPPSRVLSHGSPGTGPILLPRHFICSCGSYILYPGILVMHPISRSAGPPLFFILVFFKLSVYLLCELYQHVLDTRPHYVV